MAVWQAVIIRILCRDNCGRLGEGLGWVKKENGERFM